jgi:hypothetical protein
MIIVYVVFIKLFNIITVHMKYNIDVLNLRHISFEEKKHIIFVLSVWKHLYTTLNIKYVQFPNGFLSTLECVRCRRKTERHAITFVQFELQTLFLSLKRKYVEFPNGLCLTVFLRMLRFPL